MSLLTNLQAYYQFQNNSNDVSGNGNDGTDSNVTYGAGVIGQAAVLNGTTSRIAVGTGLAHASGDMTLSAWIKSNSLADYQFIMAKTTDGTNANLQWGFYIEVTLGRLSFWNGNVEVHSSAVITIGSFMHVVFVIQSGVLTGYVNGVAGITTPSITYGAGGSTLPVHIGTRDSSDNVQTVNGSLDELGLWDRALTSTEVLELYNAGAGLTYPFSSSLQLGASLLATI